MRAAETPPEGLTGPSADLWAGVVGTYELDQAERASLLAACRTLTELVRIEAELGDASSMVVEGSTGQPVAHPLLEEARRHRKVLAEQLRAVGLPQADDIERSNAGRQLARVRWGQHGA